MNVVTSLSCLRHAIRITSVFARLFVLMATVACLQSCASKPSVLPVTTNASTNPPQNSRYVFLPPIDDNGVSSGAHAVTICLPPGYATTDRRYPVIYVLDGEMAFLTAQHGMWDAIGYEMAHDQLVHEGLIEPAIFVAVHNNFDSEGRFNRGVDYRRADPEADKDTPPARRWNGEGFYKYLSQTIKPLIDRTYRTRPEPASTGLAGFSLSGLAAFWMTYEHPETFGMALCQSPAPPIKDVVDRHKGPVPKVRLWLDAGSREADNGSTIPQTAIAVCRQLLTLGFRQNDNLAFYIGHNQGHEKFDCNQRMRGALYFLLRTRQPELTGLEIVETGSLDPGPIRLNRTGNVALEAVYDNWFRLTDFTARFEITDPTVATLLPVSNQVQPRSPGTTTIISSFAGRRVEQQLVVDPPPSPLPCDATTRRVVVDGDLSDWPDRSIKVDATLKTRDAPYWTGPADLSYRFACQYDEQFLYIAVETVDDQLRSVPDKDPWLQDGIEVRVDARPTDQRLLGKGDKEGQDLLLVAMSPAHPGEKRLPYQAAQLPSGTQVICKVTPGGYITEIAIPVAYLNTKAGKTWTDFRLNIVVNDLDNNPTGSKGFQTDKLWWQPDWRYSENIWGSGTFKRQPALQ